MSEHSISASDITYENNGGGRIYNKNDFTLGKAFDRNFSTTWISEAENSETFKNSVTVRFSGTQTIEAMLYVCARYSGNASGYPTTLNIYSSTGGQDFVLAGSCQSAAVTAQVVFKFAKPITCDAVKIEFAEVCVYDNPFFGAAKNASAGELIFYRPQKITASVATAEYSNGEYLSAYKVPASHFTYQSAEGESASLEKAFDGNWGTEWATSKDNSGTFKNAITVEFNSALSIDRIVYACSSYPRAEYGYPTILKIYTAASAGGDLTLLGTCGSAATNDRVVFNLGEAVTVKKLKFEYYAVNPNHRWQATAKEIQFFQPENRTVKDIMNIFNDYAQTTVNKTCDSIEKINAFKKEAKDYLCYETFLKPKLERAENIIKGLVKYDALREFSTAENARNRINQYGDVRGYITEKLKFTSFGTNRQVTGVAGLRGETITVYVDAEEGDPLPTIFLSQYHGHWRKWGATYTLTRGRNVFTYPDCIIDDYTVDVVPGGSIYLINPYTPEEQSSNVKVYIEGGTLFPVFRDGDDETAYRMHVEDYYNKKIAADKNVENPNLNSKYIDISEIVTKHAIITVPNSYARDYYITKGINPQSVADRWKVYMENLLSFGGVQFEEGKPNYDVRNNYINVNIRRVQPWNGALAFAAGDHIGCCSDLMGGLTGFSETGQLALGWGIAHEIGHTLDISERTWGEVTNNMWSIFDKVTMERSNDDRGCVTAASGFLASDRGLTKTLYGETYPGTETLKTQMYTVWWMICGLNPSYWGNLENLYRYQTDRGEGLEPVEKFVYFSSLAMGMDMTEYFERWGYFMPKSNIFTANNRFTYAKSSQAYKNKIQQAKASGEISGDCKKIWYYDYQHFVKLRADYYGKLDDPVKYKLYTESTKIQNPKVNKTATGYTLYLPAPADADKHLGYEILEKNNGQWQVIGFCRSDVFVDNYDYGARTPVYKIRAYDRYLCCSATSEERSFTTAPTENVCRIGGTYYTSLNEAVANAAADSTIYVTKNCELGGLVIDKNVTITIDPSLTADVVLTRMHSGNMITVNKGVTLTLTGGSKKLILDGGGHEQAGSIIYVNGTLSATGNNLVLRNNKNTSNGGAIFSNGNTTVNNTEISGNTALNGGAIFTNNITLRLTNTVLKDNKALNDGGAIYTVGNAGLANCQVSGNTARRGGGIITQNGAILAVSGTTFTGNGAERGGGLYADGKTTLTNCTVTQNTASIGGGGLFVSCNGNQRAFTLAGGKIFENVCTASNSDAIYFEKGNCAFNKDGNNACDVNGYVYVNNTGAFILTVNHKMFIPDNATFVIKNFTDGATLFTAGFAITEQNAAAVKILNGEAYLDGTAVKVRSDKVTVTLVANGEENKTQAILGSNYVLNESDAILPTGKYALSWTVTADGQTKTYKNGESFVLNGDVTLTPVVADMAKVTVVYAEGTVDGYVVPGSRYYFTSNAFSWMCNGKRYWAGDYIEVNSDTKIFAEYLGKFLLLLNGKDTCEGILCSYGEKVTLPEPEDVTDFDGWEINGTKYMPGEKIAVVQDTFVYSNANPTTPSKPSEPTNPSNSSTTLIIVLVSVAVCLVIAGGLTAFLIIRKKNNR